VPSGRLQVTAGYRALQERATPANLHGLPVLRPLIRPARYRAAQKHGMIANMSGQENLA